MSHYKARACVEPPPCPLKPTVTAVQAVACDSHRTAHTISPNITAISVVAISRVRRVK
jgi:hypothetical protein